MTQYEVIETLSGQEVIQKTNEDGIVSYIPNDLANSDYQTYLRWLNGEEEGSIN